MRKTLILASLLIIALSCGRRGGSGQQAVLTRSFPRVEVPAMITDPSEQLVYILDHYWDGFFAGDWPTDSAVVLGVPSAEVNDNISLYVALLDKLPVPEAQARLKSAFSKIQARQQKDTSSLFYLLFTESLASCLYDPNSPLRSEDLYLPFVEGMVGSGFTPPDRLAGYRFELEKCRLNPYGSKVPDFKFKDASGRMHHLYGEKAGYTMLFFSNPGCTACKEIIDEIGSRAYVPDMIKRGELAIVNIYIDDEVDKWREYEPSYPRDWVNGYDFSQIINSDALYYVRAIPSLYLLDSQKRVIYKDAPVERVLLFLDDIQTNQ